MIEYVIVRSKRKTLSLQIKDDCSVVVRAPYLYPKYKIAKFVEKHNDWIIKSITAKEKASAKFDNLSGDEIKSLKKQLKEYLPDKIRYYSELMGVEPAGYKVTSARKRFGSCSGKNSLCFSYILMLYPYEAIDYVIVHELAHIRYRNHSRDFYNFIEEVMPDYKRRQDLLKNYD